MFICPSLIAIIPKFTEFCYTVNMLKNDIGDNVLNIWRKLPLEKLTLFTILIIGAFYLFVFPPNSIPDESDHFRAAYQNAGAVLRIASEDVNSVAMRQADVEMMELYLEYPDASTYELLRERLFKPLPEGGARIVDMERKSGVPHPYIYIPQTLGLLLGYALNVNPEWVFLLGRIFNLIFFAICVYFAIRLTPVGKGMFAIVALFPMAMHLAASQNSDVYTISLAFLALAQYLRIVYSDEYVKTRDLLLMLLTMALLGPPKVVFIPIMMLAFFLPGRCFSARKNEILFRLLVVAVFIATTYIAYYVYMHRADGGVPIVTFPGIELNTFDHLFADPVLFMKMCKRTIVGYFEFYYHSMIGANLGWLEIHMNKIVMNGFMALAVLGAFKASAAEKSLIIRDRILFPVIFMLAALGTAIIMFLSWTAVGSWDIMGIQGRYFLPAWPLFLLFAARWPKPVRPSWLSDKNLVYIACALHIVVLMSAYMIISGREM